MSRVVCAGHICLDLIPTLHHAFEFNPGALVDVGAPTISTGGSVSNTGLALYRLGMEVELIGRIGNDGLGAMVRQVLEKEGAKTAMAVSPTASTSYTVVLNPPGQDRMFLHHPGANHEFSGADVSGDSLYGASLLHLGYPPLMRQLYLSDGQEVADLFKRARTAGVLTSLDMALPDPDSEAGQVDWKRWLANVLPYCDLFQPSAQELRRMLRHMQAPVEDLAAVALGLGAQVVAIKDGSQGLYAAAGPTLTHPLFPAGWAGQTVKQPCFSVPVVGTTGAGDATVAGFLVGLLRGESLQETARIAVGVGAWCVTRPDALSGIPTWQQIAEWLTAH